MKCHPDRKPGDKNAEKQFKEAAEAYEILSDPQKKQQYDQFGHAAFAQGGGFNPNDFGGGGASSDIFNDIFGDFFGGGRRQQKPDMSQPGGDVRYDVSLTLEEAFKGVSKKVSYRVNGKCAPCKGTGSKDKNAFQNCSTCRGQGRIRMQQGFFMMEQTCHTCQGAGKIIKDPCASCRGQGRFAQQKTTEVKIPAGVEDDVRVRMSDAGESGLRGGPAGDLYVYVNVKPHKVFTRRGSDLLCKIPMPMIDCALGAEIEVPLIEGGSQKATIPVGTQSGSQIKVRGKGMSVLQRQTRGDLVIECQVETPVNLSDKQTSLLKEFKEESKNRNNSPDSKGFFGRLKEWFQ